MCPPVGDAALVDAGGSTSARDKEVLGGVFALSTAPARASTVTGRPCHREDGPTETGVNQCRLQARSVVQLIKCEHHNAGVSSSLAKPRWGSRGAWLLVPHGRAGHRCLAAGRQRSSRDRCQLADYSRGLFVSAGQQGPFGFFELGPGRFVASDGGFAGLVAFTKGSGFGFGQFGELSRQGGRALTRGHAKSSQ